MNFRAELSKWGYNKGNSIDVEILIDEILPNLFSQQERSYSEQEMLPIIEYIQWVIRKIDAGNTPEEIVRLLLFEKDKIEQFKKK